MPKVSKIKLTLKSTYGEDYEIHYNAKDKPMFSVKGMPEDFERVTEGSTSGYNTESELYRAIHGLVHKYKEAKLKSKKVIVYSASASSELRMNKVSKGSYQGYLKGISDKLKDSEFGAETAAFGISYDVKMEVDHTNKKMYHHIKENGDLGHGRSLGHKEQVMEWSEEREMFFASIYESMRGMVLKISGFIEKDSELAALMIDNKQSLLGY